MLGINSDFDDFSASMIGRTEDTTPGSRFNPHVMERKPEEMQDLDLHAKRVMMQYADIALINAFQIDNIVRINDLLDALNYRRTGDKDIDYEASIIQRNELGEVTEGSRMGVFIKSLANFRDMLAGKKTSGIDKEVIESKFARKGYAAIDAITRQNAVTKVIGNTKTAVLNALPLSRAATMFPVEFLPAGVQMVGNLAGRVSGKQADNFADSFDFYASRILDDKTPKTTYDKVTKTLNMPQDLVDAFATEWISRTVYNHFKKRFKGADPEKLRRNVDSFVLDLMAGNGPGQKASVYNGKLTGLVFQFTKEPVNDLRFMLGDVSAYSGFYDNDAKSRLFGAAKALATLIAQWMFVAPLFNTVAGRGTVFSPKEAIQGAISNREDGESWATTVLNAGTNLLDAMNPIESMSDGSVFSIPAISSLKTFATDTLWGGSKGLYHLVRGEESADDPLWAENAVKAIVSNLVPAGASLNRIYDTTKAASQGYATTKKGKVKFAYDANPVNFIQGSLFGINSVRQGAEYSKNFKPWTNSKWDTIQGYMKDYGETASQAESRYNKVEEINAQQKEYKEAVKWGVDNRTMKKDAQAAREELDAPGDLSSYAAQNIKSTWVSKGIELWKKTGKKTYPTDISGIFHDQKNGTNTIRYATIDGRNYVVTPEQEQKIIDKYNRQAKMILTSNSDPDVIEKKLSSLPSDVKRQVLGR